jgi:hypothetical protein
MGTGLELGLRTLISEVVRAELREQLARHQQIATSPELVTAAAYAARRSISVSTVRAAIREHRIDTVRIGRAVRLRADAEIGRRPVNEQLALAAREARRQRLIGSR